MASFVLLRLCLEWSYLDLGVHNECLKQFLAGICEMLGQEMHILEVALVRSAKTSLHREDVRDFKLSPEGHSRS